MNGSVCCQWIKSGDVLVLPAASSPSINSRISLDPKILPIIFDIWLPILAIQLLVSSGLFLNLLAAEVCRQDSLLVVNPYARAIVLFCVVDIRINCRRLLRGLSRWFRALCGNRVLLSNALISEWSLRQAVLAVSICTKSLPCQRTRVCGRNCLLACRTQTVEKRGSS